MISAVESPALSSNAYDWLSSAPWSKRTVTTYVNVPISIGQFYLRDDDKQLQYGSDWVRVTLEKYDTDTYISPVNVRVSCSGFWLDIKKDSESWYNAYRVTPQFRVRLTSGASDNYILDTGSLTSPMINYPVSNPDTNYYWVAVGAELNNVYDYMHGTSGLGYNIRLGYTHIRVAFTYDIYYKDEANGSQNLPTDWTNNTTQNVTTASDVLPTFTTAVDIDHVDIEEYDISQNENFMSAIFSTLSGFSYTYNLIAGDLPYWWAIIIGLAFLALIAWLLH